jgi:hypothetical protein
MSSSFPISPVSSFSASCPPKAFPINQKETNDQLLTPISSPGNKQDYLSLSNKNLSSSTSTSNSDDLINSELLNKLSMSEVFKILEDEDNFNSSNISSNSSPPQNQSTKFNLLEKFKRAKKEINAFADEVKDSSEWEPINWDQNKYNLTQPYNHSKDSSQLSLSSSEGNSGLLKQTKSALQSLVKFSLFNN